MSLTEQISCIIYSPGLKHNIAFLTHNLMSLQMINLMEHSVSVGTDGKKTRYSN